MASEAETVLGAAKVLPGLGLGSGAVIVELQPVAETVIDSGAVTVLLINQYLTVKLLLISLSTSLGHSSQLVI